MPNALLLFICSALLFSSTFVSAQSCCEIKRDAGQKAFDKGDYTTVRISDKDINRRLHY